jgi:hypothetical protein
MKDCKKLWRHYQRRKKEDERGERGKTKRIKRKEEGKAESQSKFVNMSVIY